MFTKYRELGLSLIPLQPGTKRPLDGLYEWQKYCDELPSERQAEIWEANGYTSYGLATGRASGVIALDIDSDDRKILDACPPSHVIKRGKKGETRFYRFHPDIGSGKIANIIDVLAGGKQTVLPPTVHFETNEPYIWLTPYPIDSVSKDELPVLTPGDIENIRITLEPEIWEKAAATSGTTIDLKGPFYNQDPKRSSPTGSQSRLVCIVNAMIAKGYSPDEAVRELLRYDEENHFGPYFKDKTRGADAAIEPFTNALCFYASNLKTFNRRMIRTGKPPVPPLISGSELVDISALDSTPPKVKGFESMPWPEPTGGLKDIQNLILDFSHLHQPGLALGGAISIASVAIANRLRLGTDTWPNVFVINVAPTGGGKGASYDIIGKLFSPENGLDLIGASGYRSSSALMKDLETRRERLDVLDECSSLFRTIRDGGIFQQDLLDILSSLWTSSHTVFRGPEAAAKERLIVHNPCVSALFSTTQEGMKQSTSRDFLTHGLLPRCLIFQAPDYGAKQERTREAKWNEVLGEKVIAQIKYLQTFGHAKDAGNKNLLSTKANPDMIDCAPNVKTLLSDFGYECREEIRKEECGEVRRQFLTRGGQQASKLALIHGAFRTLRVEAQDVEWAIATLKAVWHNASDLVGHLNAENTQESNVERILSIITKAGSITQSKIIGRTRALKTSERMEILHSLEAEGRIKKQTIPGTTKSTTIYTLV